MAFVASMAMPVIMPMIMPVTMSVTVVMLVAVVVGTRFLGAYLAGVFGAAECGLDHSPGDRVFLPVEQELARALAHRRATGLGGKPVLQRMETVRVALSVPDGAVPATGWPTVLYAHGTGGSYRSFVNDGSARRFAAEGFAVMGTDQIMNGTRIPDGDSPELSFYNFQNPLAGRDNSRQGRPDTFQLVRLRCTAALDGLPPNPGAAGPIRGPMVLRPRPLGSPCPRAGRRDQARNRARASIDRVALRAA